MKERSRKFVVETSIIAYIKEQTGLKCSANLAPVLSAVIKETLNQAMDRTRADKRRIVEVKDL